MRAGALALLAGVGLFQWLPALPAPLWLLAVVPLVWLLRRTRRGGLALAVVAGFLWSWLHGVWLLGVELPPSLAGRDMAVSGYVVGLPQREEGRTRFILDPDELPAGMRSPLGTGRLLLTWYGDAPDDLGPGQYWRLTVRLRRPRGLLNPGGFDYEGWLFQQRIRVTGYVRDGGGAQRVAARQRWSIDQWRQSIARAIERLLAGHPSTGMIGALAIGDQQRIGPEQWEVFAATGTTHLMAISGSHVALVAGLCLLLAGRLWRLCGRCCLYLPAPRAAALAALAAAAWYAGLAGFSVPTQRALVMLGVALGAVWWQRPTVASRALAVALGAVLVYDPLAVLAPGFWLSFGAVAVLLYGMTGRVAAGGWWWHWGRAQWLVAVGLLPLVAYLFGQTSLIAPLVNLVAIPWVGVVVALALGGVVLLVPAEPLAALLLRLAAEVADLLWYLLAWSADAVERVYLPGPSVGAVACALLGIAWLLAPRGWPARWLGLGGLLPLLGSGVAAPPPGAAAVTVLDVGQGLSVVVRTAAHTLVYDVGPRYSARFDAGEAVLVPYLRHSGIGRIDMLVVSHGDDDHVGGLPGLFQAFVPGRLLSGQPEVIGHGARPCRGGGRWRWDGVEFAFLWPPAGYDGRGDNDRSCVLKVSAAGRALLLTGDIGAGAEAALVRAAPGDLRADLLVAPHHGSASSSSPPFLAAVAPRWALVSNGWRVRERFPAPAVRERYRGAGIETVETAAVGPISVRLGADGIAVTGYRERLRRYWRPLAGDR